MKEKNTFEVTIEFVRKVQTFQRRNGAIGQKLQCENPNDDRYPFTYECCDQSDFNFGSLVAGHKYTCLAEPYLRLENVKCNDGNMRYLNIPSFRLLGVTGEID